MSGATMLIIEEAKTRGLRARVSGKTITVVDPKADRETYLVISKRGEFFRVEGWIKEKPICESYQSAWEMTEIFECA